MSNNQVWLNIPFTEKERAKNKAGQAGTRIIFDFDGCRKWYWEGDKSNLPKALSIYLPQQEKSKYPPSAEQQVAIDNSKLGLSISVNACAGSGKTKTVVDIVAELSKQGKKGMVFYFGRENAKEGRTKLANYNVECSTFHSVAYRSLPRSFDKSRIKRVTPKVLAPFVNYRQKTIYAALFCLDAYGKSGDDNITKKHIENADKREKEEVQKIIRCAKKIWSMQTDSSGTCPISQQTYLKMWSLKKPQLNAYYIVVDEFQDTSPVNLAVIKRFQEDGGQVIFVGDKNQAIFGFSGAVNAFKKVAVDKTLHLTRTFRNGQAIADLAALLLNSHGQQNISFTGLQNEASVIGLSSPEAYITRTNYMLIDRLMTEVDAGRLPYIVGGAQELLSLIYDCNRLMKGEKVLTGDLSSFGNWAELLEYSETRIGADLAPLVMMIKNHGIIKLIQTISSVKDNDREGSDISLTTAHKSKGLEFKSVQLGSDFVLDRIDRSREGYKNDNEPNTLKEESLNLLYVAITRTLGDLDVSRIPFLSTLHQQE